jgi:zinc protease
MTAVRQKRFLCVSLWSSFCVSLCWLLTAAVVGLGAQQAPDRSKAPKPGPLPTLTPPPVVKRTLSNGLPVWLVELHKVPVVQVSLVIKAGSAVDPAGKFGLASFTADMLDEGAGTRDSLGIADAVDYLGAQLSTSSSFDSSSVDLYVPSARLANALPIMADVALRPTFPEKELNRVRDELLTSFVEAEDDPASLIRFAFPRLVFGEKHRYGTSAYGTPASVKGFTAADMKAFHAHDYVPGHSVLIVAGDVTASRLLPLLESSFGTWKGAAPPARDVGAATQLTARQVYLIDKPGAAQSQIRIGWVGVPRSTPDFFALRVLNTILGGAFTSRLNTNLREEHGYSYGASSLFDMRASAGPFFAAAGVQSDKTKESLQEFFKELENIHTAVPREELEKAKSYLALQLPANFETTQALAGSLETQFTYDLPADYFATYIQRVMAVTSADVKRVAEKYIQPGKFAVVIIGDRKTIEPGVQSLNLGPLKVVTAAEVLR